jgi:hypothetical protein
MSIGTKRSRCYETTFRVRRLRYCHELLFSLRGFKPNPIQKIKDYQTNHALETGEAWLCEISEMEYNVTHIIRG